MVEAHMNTLRDKVAKTIQAAAGDNWNIAPLSDGDAEYLANRILAIPEIAEALAIIPPFPIQGEQFADHFSR
jgi:hypothetical protein